MSRTDADADEPSTDTPTVRRRRFIEATGAGVATTALAGCLPEEEDGEDGGDGETTPSGTPQGGTDGGTETPTGPGEPMVIGHLAPTTGDVAAIGRGSQRSAEIAKDEINQNGGLLGQEVEVVHENTESSPNTAQAAVQRLINQENVDLIVGTYVTEVTQAILAYIAEFDVPFIVTGSAAPSTVTDFIGENYERYKNFFRTGPINSFYQAQGLADYCDFLNEQHGWTTFGMAAEDGTWTRPFSNSLPDMLSARGYDLPYEERLSLSIDNWEPVRSNLDSANVDAVLRFFAHLTGGDFLGEWHTFESDFSVEGVHVAAMSPEFYELSQGYAEYCTTAQSGAGGVAEISEKTQPFVQAYRERHEGGESPGRQPMYMGFNTYDGIHFWAEVVRQAGTWDYEEYLDDLVATALDTSFTGTVGAIELFGPNGQYPHDVKAPGATSDQRVNYPVTQWHPTGDPECVYPEEYATGSHLQPNWM